MTNEKLITLSFEQVEAIELGFWNGPVKAFKDAKKHDPAFAVDDLVNLKREMLKWSYTLRDIAYRFIGISFVRRPGEFSEEHQHKPNLYDTEGALDGILFLINNLLRLYRSNSVTDHSLMLVLQRAYRSIDFIDRDILHIEAMTEQGLSTMDQGIQPLDFILGKLATRADKAA